MPHVVGEGRRSGEVSMDPRCTKPGRVSFLSLHTHLSVGIPNHQSGTELYEPGRLCGHMLGSARAELQGTQLANVFELLALQACAACCPDGKGVAGWIPIPRWFPQRSQWSDSLSALWEQSSPFIFGISWNENGGLIGFISSSCFSFSATLVAGSFCQGGAWATMKC